MGKDMFTKFSEQVQSLVTKVAQLIEDLANTLKNFSSKMEAMSQSMVEFLTKITKQVIQWTGLELQKVEELTQTLVKEIQAQLMNAQQAWTNSTFKDLFESVIGNEVWNELINEISNHEVFVLVRDILKSVVTQLGEDISSIYKNIVTMVQDTTVLLGKLFKERYQVLAKEAAALSQLVSEKLQEIKLEEVVAYLQKNYGELATEAVSRIGKLLEQAKALSVQYEKELRTFMEMYVKEVQVIFTDMQKQMMELYTTYRPVIVEEYNRVAA